MNVCSSGASFALLERLDAGDFEISVSVPLILEHEAVAQRLARELGVTHADVAVVLDFLCTVAHHRQIFFLWRPFLRDPNDDMVLEVAVEAQCSDIVTFNLRDFVASSNLASGRSRPDNFLRCQETRHEYDQFTFA